ncbi:MAG: hypothetical protein LH660_15530, partial [Phormidesmis sp. CAN_BIN36]|nr:hypothetical protein [Phormidesmis sp. CAN_BIN36]
ATPGSLVVILPESVNRAIQLIEARNPVQVVTPVTQPTVYADRHVPVEEKEIVSRAAIAGN